MKKQSNRRTDSSLYKPYLVLTVFVALMFVLMSGFAYASGLDTWSQRTSGTTNNLNGVVYGNGTFVAVGDGEQGTFLSTILTSPDGATWTLRSSGTTFQRLSGVTYGNGIFVAVGLYGTILTSSDGITWIQRGSPSDQTLKGITYGNGKFVVVGQNATILTSPDAFTWTQISLPYSGSTFNLYGVAYGNGTFVAVGERGEIYTSSDGEAWVRQTNSSTSLYWCYGITYGNDIFVAVGSAGSVLTSLDGVTWTPRSSLTTYDLNGITYGNGVFVAVGLYGEILTSPDGVTWTVRVQPASLIYTHLRGIAYGKSTFVAVGNSGKILQSDIVDTTTTPTPSATQSPIPTPAPTPTTAATPSPAPTSTTIFDNGNIYGVSNGPTSPTTFSITQPYTTTLIMTYHWNNGAGKTAGTISLKHSNGTIYGPWQATGYYYYGSWETSDTSADTQLYWIVKPNVEIDTGTYTIDDSDPSTWSQNSESGHQGMALVQGYTAASVSTPTPSPTSTPGRKGSISGSVIDTDGEPIKAVKITLKGKKTKMRKTTSEEDGYFEFTDLKADTYRLTATKKGYRIARQKITLKAGKVRDDIEIEMQKKRSGH